jgi:hypothetical protein
MNELQKRDQEVRKLLDMISSQMNTSRTEEESLQSDEKFDEVFDAKFNEKFDQASDDIFDEKSDELSQSEIETDPDIGILKKIQDIRDIIKEENLSVRTRIKEAWKKSLHRKQTPDFRDRSDFHPASIYDELDRAKPFFEDSWKKIQFISELEDSQKTSSLSTLQFNSKDFNFQGTLSDLGSMEIKQEPDYLEF